MANLIETTTWPEGIYQIEEDDPVLGGATGITNRPPTQLAARSKFQRVRNITPWDAGFLYPVNAYVHHGGKTWVSTMENSNVAPGTDAFKWVRWGYTSDELSERLAAAIPTPATQPEVDSGADDAKFVTPKKLASRLASYLVQATEVAFGWAKVSTQVEVDAGTDDATLVTPKKLRFGFASLFATNGYIAFPSWLGGFFIQWGTASVAGTLVVTFPVAFPSTTLAGYGVGLSADDSIYSSSAWVEVSIISVSQMLLKVISASASGNVLGNRGVGYLVLGR